MFYDLQECYRVLDLEPGATPEEVKRSYRELVKIWHPDRFTHDPKLQDKAQEKLKKINHAYGRIRDIRAESPPPKKSTASPRPPQKHQSNQRTTYNSSSTKQASQARQAPPPPQPPPQPSPKPTSTQPPTASHKGTWGKRVAVSAAVLALLAFIAGVLTKDDRDAIDLSEKPMASPRPAGSYEPTDVGYEAPLHTASTRMYRYTPESSASLKELASQLSLEYAGLKAHSNKLAREIARMRTGITEELLIRIDEAKANLEKEVSVFRDLESDFLKTRNEQEKLTSEISKQIAVAQSRLKAARTDSAEQYYGTLLKQLLDSFRDDALTSGLGKFSKSADSANILVHAPRSQFSKNSNGHEDFSNVRGLYFVSDFAFLNLPARNYYSRSERRRIDKLIQEYFSERAAYNAQARKLARELEEDLLKWETAESDALIKLESIGTNESASRGSVVRSQELFDRHSAALVAFKANGVISGKYSEVLAAKASEMRKLQDQLFEISFEEFVRRKNSATTKNQSLGRPSSVTLVPNGGTIQVQVGDFIVLYKNADPTNGVRARYSAVFATSKLTVVLDHTYRWDGELDDPDPNTAIAAGVSKTIADIARSLPH